jgi:hypothetical protein
VEGVHLAQAHLARVGVRVRARARLLKVRKVRKALKVLTVLEMF